MNTMNRIRSYIIFGLLILKSLCVSGYSGHNLMIIELEDKQNHCYKITLNEDDDVMTNFMLLPHGTKDEVEEFYYNKFLQHALKGSENKLEFTRGDLPADILNLRDTSMKDKSKYVKLYVKNLVSTSNNQGNVRLHPFSPHMRRINAGTFRDKWSQENIFEFCFEAVTDELVSVIFSLHKNENNHTVKKHHLKPLERSFDLAIEMSRQILDEIKYFEKREARMKHTADSTNARVRRFSYMSIGILLGISVIQIKYLKSFFKKKKIL